MMLALYCRGKIGLGGDAADAGPSAGPWLKGIGDDAADAGPKHRGDKKFGG